MILVRCDIPIYKYIIKYDMIFCLRHYFITSISAATGIALMDDCVRNNGNEIYFSFAHRLENRDFDDGVGDTTKIISKRVQMKTLKFDFDYGLNQSIIICTTYLHNNEC